MAKFVTFPGTAGSYASTDDVNLLDCDSSWFVQGTGGLWTVGAPSTEQAWINTQSLKVLAGASTAITPATDAAFFSLYVYSAAGDTFDINGSTPVVVSAGVWTRIKEAGPDGTYTVSAVGAADYYLDGVIVQATDAAFVPSTRIVGSIEIETQLDMSEYDSGSIQTLVSKWSGTGSQKSYRLDLQATGGLSFLWSENGSANLQGSSTQVLTGTGLHIIKATMGVADGTGGQGQVTFYVDGVQFGNQLNAGSIPTSIFSGSIGVFIGQQGNANWIDGDVYYTTVRDGIDGPIVAQFNAEDISL